MPASPRSHAVLARARRIIPGVSQLLSKHPDRFAPGVWPAYFDRASGAEVWDLDGNHYIDMSIGGIGATVLGYAHPEVDAAVRDAISRGSASSLNCAEEVDLAERFCALHPWADRVRFARGGGEAMAIAVRIARAHTGRDVIAFCGYHGWHDWYLAANLGAADALAPHLMSGLDPAGVPKALAGTAFPFRYNQLEDLDVIIRDHGNDLAAIVMEPIRSVQPAPGFLDGVRQRADATGAVLICDEVSAAFRLTTGGAHRVLGLTPDIAVFSKAMGNGYPIAAVIGRANVMAAAERSFISSTMWTERIGPVAALATIAAFERANAAAHLNAIGQRVQEGWRRIATAHNVPIDVGGISPLAHFGFEHPDKLALKALFISRMLDRGFLATLSFYAMLSHTTVHVDAYLAAADGVFAEIADAIRAGDAATRVPAPAVAGFGRLT